MKLETKFALRVLIALLFFPAASHAQTVTYNYARGVNFTEFKTYEWMNIERTEAIDPVLDDYIRAAIDAQLGGMGLAKSHDSAHLLIVYQASIAREEQILMHEGYSRYGPGWSHDSGYGYSRGPAFVSPFLLSTETGSIIQIGDLVLDIYDSAYRDLVWRGRVSQAISFSGELRKRQQRLNKAVAKLIKAYPQRPIG